MKKIVVILTSLILCFSCFACGKAENNNTGDKAADVAVEKTGVWFSTGNKGFNLIEGNLNETNAKMVKSGLFVHEWDGLDVIYDEEGYPKKLADEEYSDLSYAAYNNGFSIRATRQPLKNATDYEGCGYLYSINSAGGDTFETVDGVTHLSKIEELKVVPNSIELLSEEDNYICAVLYVDDKPMDFSVYENTAAELLEQAKQGKLEKGPATLLCPEGESVKFIANCTEGEVVLMLAEEAARKKLEAGEAKSVCRVEYKYQYSMRTGHTYADFMIMGLDYSDTRPNSN